jgi:sugar phosphate isomerase/epimerase
MDYGIKCEPHRLAAEDWQAAYGDLPALARLARAQGASFIELRWDEKTQPHQIQEAARQAAGEGLWVSIHPYLWHLGPETFQESTHGSALRQVLDLAEEVSGVTRHDVPLTIHAGHVHMPPHNAAYVDALEGACAFFAWATRETQSRPHVRVVSETQLPTNPAEPLRRRIGDTWAECLRTVEGTPLGVCWDFGHTFIGARQSKHAPVPPPEFLRQVRHVHAHDVIERAGELVDHQPLGTGIAPWRENCRALASVGYRGGILFEIDIMTLGGPSGLDAMLDFATAEIDAIFARTPRRDTT